MRLLTLLLCSLAQGAAFAQGQAQSICDRGSAVTTGITSKERACAGAGSGQSVCGETAGRLLQWQREYQTMVSSACNSANAFRPAAGTDQRAAHQQNLQVLQQARASVQQLLDKNKSLLEEEIPDQSTKNVQEMENIGRREGATGGRSRVVERARALFRRNNSESHRNEQISEQDVQSAVSQPQQAQTRVLAFSSTFARSLLDDKQKRQAALAQIDSQITSTQAALARAGGSESSANGGKSGLDSKDLAALAPLAGAAAQAAQKQPSNSDSGISGSAPITTDTARNQPDQPDSSGPAPALLADSAGTTSRAKNPIVQPVPLTSPSNLGSKGDAGSGISSADPAIAESDKPGDAFVGAIGSALGSTGLGQLFSGGKGSSATGAEGSRAPAATKNGAAAEEALESFSGGGSLNYGMNGGGNSSQPPPEDDSMKEIIHEMESAADLEGDFGEEAGESLQADGVAAAESEDLFRRVSGAYLRSMKKGRVYPNLENVLGGNVSL